MPCFRIVQKTLVEHHFDHIEYLDPKTGDINKILQWLNVGLSGNLQLCAKVFENGSKSLSKDIWLFEDKLFEPILIVRKYSNGKLLPDQAATYSLNKKNALSFVEFNKETGYPYRAYADGTIYTPRKNNCKYLDSILSDEDVSLVSGFYRNHRDLDLRVTKGGYIVEDNGLYSNDITLLDRISNKPRYRMVNDDNVFKIDEFDDAENLLHTLFLEEGQNLANTFNSGFVSFRKYKNSENNRRVN